ncbi:MAG TPA: LysE family translocator [Selenomonadales bacterium]|nr:LysE family translocator [Selenomonadales bacterium]
MFSSGEIWAFSGVVFVMIISPGPNMVLVTQTASVNGSKAAAFNLFGLVSAVFLHALVSGLGLAVVVAQSAAVFSLIKLIGAGYIVYLGASSVYQAYRLHRERLESGEPAAALELAEESPRSAYIKGFVTNILNVATAFVFLALFPQFIHPQASVLLQSLVLTLIFVAIQISWYSSLIFFISKLRSFILRSSVQKWIKATTGTMLVAMGVRIALR